MLLLAVAAAIAVTVALTVAVTVALTVAVAVAVTTAAIVIRLFRLCRTLLSCSCSSGCSCC